MDTNATELENRWAAAIRDKVFSANAYEMTLPNGVVLRNGCMLIIPSRYETTDGTPKSTIDDTMVRAAFRDKMRDNVVRVCTVWDIPGTCLGDARLETLFAVNQSMETLDLYNYEGMDAMCCYKATTPTMELFGITSEFRLVDGKTWMRTYRRSDHPTQMYDINTDLVYRVCRRDEFATEAKFLNVYGTHTFPSVLGG